MILSHNKIDLAMFHFLATIIQIKYYTYYICVRLVRKEQSE